MKRKKTKKSASRLTLADKKIIVEIIWGVLRKKEQSYRDQLPEILRRTCRRIQQSF